MAYRCVSTQCDNIDLGGAFDCTEGRIPYFSGDALYDGDSLGGVNNVRAIGEMSPWKKSQSTHSHACCCVVLPIALASMITME